MQAIRRARMPLLGKILLLALAYLVAGRLALLLAIPPGFVSAMFPPVGIALAAVLIWGYPLLLGVLLGSTLLNLSVGGPLSLPVLLVASGIALGTTLQCALGCWLIRRVVSFPNALIDENLPVVFLGAHDPASPESHQRYEKILNNIKEVKSRDGIIVAIGNENETDLIESSDHFVGLSPTNEFLLPILEVIPLQLLAYHCAVRRGCDIDQPRNLAKSVTVE